MKRKQFKGLGDNERNEIEILSSKGYGVREIARVLGRSPNTVSYEINNNSVNGQYVAKKAKGKARVRRKSRRFQQYKIEKDLALRDYVINGLKQHWNPDEISGSMKATSQPFYISKTQIYAWLYSAYGQPYCQYLYSGRYRPKKRSTKKASRVMIPNRVSLDQRPLGATNLSRYGHWQGDTIVSSKKTGSKAALSVFVEPKAKFGQARLIARLQPTLFAQASNRVLANKKALSLLLDNGIENKDHQAMNVAAFFCDSYSSWQKPHVEHYNKMLRRYIPKGTDLNAITQSEVDAYVTIINNKPRKSLGYKSAVQLANEKGILRK